MERLEIEYHKRSHLSLIADCFLFAKSTVLSFLCRCHEACRERERDAICLRFTHPTVICRVAFCSYIFVKSWIV
jgi:hypothetical protein